MEKTEGIKLGNFENNKNDNFCNMTWKKHIKALGVYFGCDNEKMRGLNWNSKVEKQTI